MRRARGRRAAKGKEAARAQDRPASWEKYSDCRRLHRQVSVTPKHTRGDCTTRSISFPAALLACWLRAAAASSTPPPYTHAYPARPREHRHTPPPGRQCRHALSHHHHHLPSSGRLRYYVNVRACIPALLCAAITALLCHPRLDTPSRAPLNVEAACERASKASNRPCDAAPPISP